MMLLSLRWLRNKLCSLVSTVLLSNMFRHVEFREEIVPITKRNHHATHQPSTTPSLHWNSNTNMQTTMRSRHQKSRPGFDRAIFVVSLLLCFNVTLCSGRSSHRLPLAGIFGIGGNKDGEQEQQN